MSKHSDYPEIELFHAEFREEICGLGYVISANDVNDKVEIWVDLDEKGHPAVGNLRLSAEDAIKLAEQLICAAERIEADQ